MAIRSIADMQACDERGEEVRLHWPTAKFLHLEMKSKAIAEVTLDEAVNKIASEVIGHLREALILIQDEVRSPELTARFYSHITSAEAGLKEVASDDVKVQEEFSYVGDVMREIIACANHPEIFPRGDV